MRWSIHLLKSDARCFPSLSVFLSDLRCPEAGSDMDWVHNKVLKSGVLVARWTRLFGTDAGLTMALLRARCKGL